MPKQTAGGIASNYLFSNIPHFDVEIKIKQPGFLRDREIYLELILLRRQMC